MEDQLYKIVSQIMEVPVEEINDDSSPDTIESWDSIRQMNLILAIEQKFGICFSDEQIIEMLNVALIKHFLELAILESKKPLS